MKSNQLAGKARHTLAISVLWLFMLELILITINQPVFAQSKEGAFILPPILSLLLNDDVPRTIYGDYVLLAANDLGMHCADQDH